MYYPTTTPEPLEFGVAFHKAMETFYQPMTWTSPGWIRRDLALVAFKLECDAHLKNYKKLNPDPDVTILDSYKTRVELGLNMIRYYCDTMSPVYDNNWTPLEVEVGFEVPIKDDDGNQLWCTCPNCTAKLASCTNKSDYADAHEGLPVTYGGRLDALFQDEHGRYWIADWKTTTRLLDEDAEASFLQLDDQIVSYLWALQQYGINCAGFVYVEIKKTYPQNPELLTRKYKGRMYSTNKDFMTTYDMFLDTVKAHDYDAWQMGLYDDHLLRLKSEGPRFTQRHQVHKNEHEISEAGRVIALEAMDMTANNLRIYPQPGRFSCNWCLYKTPCLGVNMGEDYQYTLDTMFEKRDRMYWEERKNSTE